MAGTPVSSFKHHETCGNLHLPLMLTLLFHYHQYLLHFFLSIFFLFSDLLWKSHFRQSRGRPVKVIRVAVVQLVARVSSGVTSFILGLHHLLSSRLEVSVLPLFPFHVTIRRFTDAFRGAAAANCSVAVLV